MRARPLPLRWTAGPVSLLSLPWLASRQNPSLLLGLLLYPAQAPTTNTTLSSSSPRRSSRHFCSSIKPRGKEACVHVRVLPWTRRSRWRRCGGRSVARWSCRCCARPWLSASPCAWSCSWRRCTWPWSSWRCGCSAAGPSGSGGGSPCARTTTPRSAAPPTPWCSSRSPCITSARYVDRQHAHYYHRPVHSS